MVPNEVRTGTGLGQRNTKACRLLSAMAREKVLVLEMGRGEGAMFFIIKYKGMAYNTFNANAGNFFRQISRSCVLSSSICLPLRHEQHQHSPRF